MVGTTEAARPSVTASRSMSEKPRRCRLTVRQAFELHYLPYALDLAESTARKMRHDWNRWERATENPPCDRITPEHFAEFRRHLRESNGRPPLAPDSIECTISSVLTVLNHLERKGLIDRAPGPGRRLKRTRRIKYVPPLQHLGLVYERADCTRWPKLPFCSTADFWRSWLCTFLFTGLRLDDQMHLLRWEYLTEHSLTVVAHKTGKLQMFPMHPVWRRHLEMVRSDRPRIYPVSQSPHLVRRELRRMSDQAGLERYITPQMLRRLAGTAWDLAKDGAGPKLLGHSLGVSDRYISVPPILKEAAPLLPIPRELLTEAERDELADGERKLVERYQHMKPAERQALLALAEKLSG